MYCYVLEHLTCEIPLPCKTKFCEYWNLTTVSFTFLKDKHRDDTHKQRQALAKKLGK